jgi:hypothetical protein
VDWRHAYELQRDAAVTKPAEFAYTYRFVFRMTLGGGAAIIVLALVVGAVAGGGIIWPMLTVSVLLALMLLLFLATNAWSVELREGQLWVRTGLGRIHTAPLYDVKPRLRGAPAGRMAMSRQVTLRLPGQRYGITVPKYPASSTIRLIERLREARPTIFDS